MTETIEEEETPPINFKEAIHQLLFALSVPCSLILIYWDLSYLFDTIRLRLFNCLIKFSL